MQCLVAEEHKAFIQLCIAKQRIQTLLKRLEKDYSNNSLKHISGSSITRGE